MLKRRKIDTFLLAAALFVISGAVLTYNVLTSDGGGISVSLSDIIENNAVSVSLIHDAAAENLQSDTVFVGAVPEIAPSEAAVGATLPPIVTPPTE